MAYNSNLITSQENANALEKEEDVLEFIINYQGSEVSLLINAYDTIKTLKHELTNYFHVPIENQQLEGWNILPTVDNTPLCRHAHRVMDNYLVLYDKSLSALHSQQETQELVSSFSSSSINESFARHVPVKPSLNVPRVESTTTETDEYASLSFVQKFLNKYETTVPLNACSLSDVVCTKLMCPREDQKILLFYFHHGEEKFSKSFCEYLARDDITSILCGNYYLLGWDLEDTEHLDSMLIALSMCLQLSHLIDFVVKKKPCLAFIVPTSDTFAVFQVLQAKLKHKELLRSLEEIEASFLEEIKVEKQLQQITGNDQTTRNSIGSREYQQLMFDMLGNRDYDNFESKELEQLKEKIGYAFFGQPLLETGYDEKQKSRIDEMFKVILDESNIYSEHKDRVVLSFIYVCTEPLASEKLKKAKKDNEYDPKTDFIPYPVFILRKCRESNQPCRMVIDHTCRVYTSWQKYIKNNKLPECIMVVPRDGRYDGNGEVYLDIFESPACHVSETILKVADVTSIVAGLGSTSVVAVAAIPAIVVAPAALIGAAAVGIGVGVYSIGRSVGTLIDRYQHKESMSFAESRARGAYINIVAGALGFAGAGATMAVSSLAANGVNIGRGATTAVNLLSVANISASGVGIANSGYDVFDQWWNENQAPSMLTIVQLSSSILFFGHAVYNFRSATVMVEEAQSHSLQKYQESLRSNRHRKTFTKLVKETIRQNDGNVGKGQAEVISMMKNVNNNKDQVFATLTRNNKQMNKLGVKFSAEGGNVKLNGVSIDLAQVNSMSKSDMNAFLSDLPSQPNPTSAQVKSFQMKVFDITQKMNITQQDIFAVCSVVMKLVGPGSLSKNIMNVVETVVMELLERFGLLSYFYCLPRADRLMRVVEVVVSFLKKEATDVKEQYDEWYKTQEEHPKVKIFKWMIDGSVGVLEIMEYICKTYFLMQDPYWIQTFKEYCFNWVSAHYLERREEEERILNRVINIVNKVNCSQCKGFYYHKK